MCQAFSSLRAGWLGTKSVQSPEKSLVSYSFKRFGSPAWARTTNLTRFEVSQLIDSKRSLKSSKAPKAGIWYKIGTESFFYVAAGSSEFDEADPYRKGHGPAYPRSL